MLIKSKKDIISDILKHYYIDLERNHNNILEEVRKLNPHITRIFCQSVNEEAWNISYYDSRLEKEIIVI